MGIFENSIIMWGMLAVSVMLLVALALWYRNGSNIDYQLQRTSRLLSPAEKNFFELLVSALSKDYYIFSKVGILDVVEPEFSTGMLAQRRMNKSLSTETLDYVVCKKHDLSIFGVVELENFEKRASREKLIHNVCKAANLRLFYFDVRQDYEGVDIRRLITGRSSKPKNPEATGASRSQFTIDNTSYAAYAKQRNCPQCNGEVVTKVAVRGKRIGEKFLMCRKYPYCDYRIAMSDKQVIQNIKRASASGQRTAEKPGFSNWSG